MIEDKGDVQSELSFPHVVCSPAHLSVVFSDHILNSFHLFLVFECSGWVNRTQPSPGPLITPFFAVILVFLTLCIGRLIHVAGPVSGAPELQDGELGVAAVGTVLERVVQMKQWKEHEHKRTEKLGNGNERVTKVRIATT